MHKSVNAPNTKSKVYAR